jgi:hypothetical protein
MVLKRVIAMSGSTVEVCQITARYVYQWVHAFGAFLIASQD